MSRFNLVQHPPSAPGACITGVGNSEWFVDLGMSIDWYGALYLSKEAVTEIAEMVGFLSPEKTADLQLENRALRASLELTQDQLNVTERALNAVRAVVQYRNHSIPESDVLESNSVPTAADEVSTGGMEATEVRVESGEAESSESSVSEGLGDIRSTSSVSTILNI